MSISKHKNTLKTLEKINDKINPTCYVSVVHMDENGQIENVENLNPSGILVVPKPMTLQEWERQGLKKNSQDSR
jgi:hypothetical protein